MELLFTTVPEAQTAFSTTSGEVYAGQQAVTARLSELFTHQVRRRSSLSAALPSTARSRGWASVLAGSFDASGDGNAAASDNSTYGFAGGIDLLANGNENGSVILGVAVGHLSSKGDVDARLSSSDIDSTQLGAYAALESGVASASIHFSYGWHEIDTRRDIVVGDLNRNVTSRRDATTFGISAEAKYALFKSPNLSVAPIVTFDLAKVKSKSAIETGAASLDLSLASENFTSARLGLGAELTFGSIASGVFGYLRAIYQNQVGDRRPSQSASLAGSPVAFVTTGTLLRESSFGLGAGIGAEIGTNIHISANYDGSFNGRATDHSGNLALTVGF